MTVKELREALGDYGQNMRVVLRQQVSPGYSHFTLLDPSGLRVDTDPAGDYVLVLEDV